MTNHPNLPASKRSDEQMKSAEEAIEEIEVGKDSPYLKRSEPEKKVEIIAGIRI